MKKCQIWDNEESNWKFRILEREKFIDLVLKQNGRILEIGPGYGRVMKIAIQNNIDIQGLEISENLFNNLKD